jgi:hypothetical protein
VSLYVLLSSALDATIGFMFLLLGSQEKTQNSIVYVAVLAPDRLDLRQK